MLKYTPFFIIILFGIFHTVKSISYYEVTKYSSVYHDMKNMFFGIYSATQGSNDLETLKEKLQGYYDVLGFDMTMAQINTENSVETIHSLIDFKLRESDKKIQIHRDILYYFDNLLVPISSVTYMIGVLIDYIISISDPEDSIKIYVCCGEYNLNIEVSYKYTKERNNVFGLINNKRLFSEEKLGHGLSNLKKMVKNYKGEFLARRKDMELMLVISIFN